jgi:hypothetical protein
MSFLGDAQEFPAIVLTELHIEMLALNLQFFRLDDVIHFPGGADSTATDLRNGSKILVFFDSSEKCRAWKLRHLVRQSDGLVPWRA